MKYHMEYDEALKYPSDMTTEQWNVIKHLFENQKKGKHLQVHTKREFINAVLYINKTGCQWRQLPHDFPNWKTVYSFYERAIWSGLWDKIRALLVKNTGESRQII